ncbi:MAG: ThiF family adenylyltransferase [Thermoguttaceae bacterium]|nr:ThiF family adenylyltransferase [Thermoguttaceae bacterium]MDW8037208.1 ThiF family adenylyltransferase [Thermoguttaceae bacterium]
MVEGRFARLTAIQWWDHQRVAGARVLVIGAGALGNEVVKNLALLGVGHLVIVDRDCVEMSNLTRSVLFRESDTGRPKASCAAQAAQEIYPALRVQAITGNVLADVGLGYFRWADVVVGALDNREARVFVNSACARVGRVWIDGGIEVMHGLVRGFAPPKTACYECTMSQVDWQLLNQRRSCLQLARRAVAAGGTPTTPITASVIGALQAQEVIKFVHGMDSLLGRGWFFDGASYDCYPVSYPINPDCPWHFPPPPIEPVASFTANTPLQTIADYAAQRLGGLDALDFARELVERLQCPSCGQEQFVWQPAEHIQEDQARCARCGNECYPLFCHSLPAGSAWLARSANQLGLPRWEIVWARYGENMLGIELAGDAPSEMSR